MRSMRRVCTLLRYQPLLFYCFILFLALFRACLLWEHFEGLAGVWGVCEGFGRWEGGLRGFGGESGGRVTEEYCFENHGWFRWCV